MKLRILQNSIRLRLTRSEVARAGAGEVVEGRCAFTPDVAHTLRYQLVPSPDVQQLEARFAEGLITVLAATKLVERWARSDAEVGMSRGGDVEGAGVAILVEKDFSCLKPREGGEDLDTFPNPAAG